MSISYSTTFAVRLVSKTSPSLVVRVAGSSSTEGARVVATSPAADAAEIWSFQPAGGFYQIVDAGSGMCLTTDQNPGHPLYQWWCSQTGGQLWQLGPGFNLVAPSLLRNAASGLYLGLDGTGNVAGQAFTGTADQYFVAALA